jgi:hypothetical protein
LKNPAVFVYHRLLKTGGKRSMKPSIRAGGKVLAASFALASCAAPGGTSVPQTTRVAYYPQCYQSVALLRQQDQQFQQTMAVNTLAGAAGGAALGALIAAIGKAL